MPSKAIIAMRFDFCFPILSNNKILGQNTDKERAKAQKKKSPICTYIIHAVIHLHSHCHTHTPRTRTHKNNNNFDHLSHRHTHTR